MNHYSYQTFPHHTEVYARKTGYTAKELRAELHQNGVGEVVWNNETIRGEDEPPPQDIARLVGKQCRELV